MNNLVVTFLDKEPRATLTPGNRDIFKDICLQHCF